MAATSSKVLTTLTIVHYFNFVTLDLNGKLSETGLWLFIAWAIHYVPFFAMGRVLYYHHYFPAAIFSTMLSAVLVDYILRAITKLANRSNTLYHIIYGTILAATFQSFYMFSPLTYGIISEGDNANNSTIQNIKWLESWEF